MSAQPSQLVNKHTSHRILIVDDNDGMRELMTEMLEDEGYIIIEADNGTDALKIVAAEQLDLILLDVRMPGISGFEVCKKVREHADESSIAIAMVTGLEDHESIETAYKLGATSFINKPINWTSFPYRIRYILKARDALAQLKQRETQLTHLDRITRILTQDKHYDTVMHEALLSILEVFDAERAFILKTDNDTSPSFDIEYGATRDTHASILGDIEPLFAAIEKHILEYKDTTEDPILSKHNHPGSPDNGLVYQQMLLALHIQKHHSWYLCVQQCHDGTPWKQNDSDIFYNLGTRLSGMLSRHLLVEQLHNSERLLKQAQQIGHIGNWHWNTTTGITSWSAEAYRILGYAPDSFIPDHNCYYRVAYDEDLLRLQQLREETFSSGKAYNIEYRIRLPEGEIHWLNEQAIGTPNEMGTVTDVSGIIQDITDRHEQQEQEAHEKKMESIGQLTSGIAHDFGNLMTIAKGNLDLLGEIHAKNSQLNDDENSILEDARSAIADSVELTRQLLDFSRKKSISPVHVNVDNQLENLCKLLNHTLTDNIELQLTVNPELDDILVDPTQLENALLNICINARNAMPDGGTIQITAQQLDADPEQYINNPMIDIGDQYISICISDTGIGMSEEIAIRAIEPFFTTRSGVGTGLGLSMVYGFMRQSKGELTIDSIENHGTSIELQFPIYKGPVNTIRHTPTEAPAQLSEATILVVEDQESVRGFVVRCLSPFDTVIYQAGNADEAIEIIRNKPDIDLVFSDIMMPGSMNGRKLADWIKQNNPEIKILLTTASASQIHRSSLSDIDSYRLLPKPYSKQELIKAIHTCLDD